MICSAHIQAVNAASIWSRKQRLMRKDFLVPLIPRPAKGSFILYEVTAGNPSRAINSVHPRQARCLSMHSKFRRNICYNKKKLKKWLRAKLHKCDIGPRSKQRVLLGKAAHIVGTDLAGRRTIASSCMVSYCHPVDGMCHCYLWVVF